MWKLVWVDSAVDDLVRLRDFIAPKNPRAAQEAAKALKNAAKQLLTHPSKGKPVEDLVSYRDLFVRYGAAGYILRYRVHLNTIFIMHIRHYREIDFKSPK